MKRFLLKLSGEALAGSKGSGIDEVALKYFANIIAEVKANHPNVELAIVVGGGNI